MKTFTLLIGLALAGLATVLGAPASGQVDGNPCEYFGMPKDWCVDGKLDPSTVDGIHRSLGSRHAPNSAMKRSDDDSEKPHDFQKRWFNHPPLSVRKRSDEDFEEFHDFQKRWFNRPPLSVRKRSDDDSEEPDL